jgi:hypothetical protein
MPVLGFPASQCMGQTRPDDPNTHLSDSALVGICHVRSETKQNSSV